MPPPPRVLPVPESLIPTKSLLQSCRPFSGSSWIQFAVFSNTCSTSFIVPPQRAAPAEVWGLGLSPFRGRVCVWVLCAVCWVAQWCLTLCYPTECSPPRSSVHGDSRVAMPSSRGSSQPRDRAQVPHIAGGFFTVWATKVWVLLASNGETPAMLLNILRCTGQPPQQEIIRPQMPTALNLRNSVLRVFFLPFAVHFIWFQTILTLKSL